MQDNDVELFVYDGFTLKEKIQNFESLVWIRRFSDVGEFSLTMLINQENIDLIKTGNILYKGADGEAALVEDIVSDDTANTFTVSGRFLSSILDRRVINYTANTNIKAIVNAIITQNFITAANTNRNIDSLRLLNYNLTANPMLDADYKNQIALDAITKICQDNSIGFKIIFSPHSQTFDFTLYEGKKTTSEFSENYKNINTQDYYYKTKSYKNTCITPFNDGVQIYGDENKGLARREVHMTAAADATASTISEAARLYLMDTAIVQSFDTVINSISPQFVYKTDWNLGDIVTISSDLWGVSIAQNVLEIAEYYDKAGTHIAPVFGDVIPLK